MVMFCKIKLHLQSIYRAMVYLNRSPKKLAPRANTSSSLQSDKTFQRLRTLSWGPPSTT